MQLIWTISSIQIRIFHGIQNQNRFEVAKWMFYGLNIDVKRPQLWKLKRYAILNTQNTHSICLDNGIFEKEFQVMAFHLGNLIYDANQQLWFRVISAIQIKTTNMRNAIKLWIGRHWFECDINDRWGKKCTNLHLHSEKWAEMQFELFLTEICVTPSPNLQCSQFRLKPDADWLPNPIRIEKPSELKWEKWGTRFGFVQPSEPPRQI